MGESRRGLEAPAEERFLERSLGVLVLGVLVVCGALLPASLSCLWPVMQEAYWSPQIVQLAPVVQFVPVAPIALCSLTLLSHTLQILPGEEGEAWRLGRDCSVLIPLLGARREFLGWM